MSENAKTSSGAGCFVQIAAITIVAGLIAWAGFDYAPKDAAMVGLQWGFGLVCGLPLTVLLLVVFAAVTAAFFGWLDAR